MAKYYQIVASIVEEGKKGRHSLRMGSATTLQDGSIVCTLDALPLDPWNRTLRLYPADDEDQGYDYED